MMRATTLSIPTLASRSCRNPLALILLAAAVMPLGACAAYLHDAQRETATASIKERFEKLTAPAYFDAQERNLADFAGREDRAVADFLISSRDYRLLNVIQPSSRSRRMSVGARLAALVNADLGATFGHADLSTAENTSLQTGPAKASLATRTSDFNQRRIADVVRRYKAAGGKLSIECDALTPIDPTAQVDSKQAEIYRQLVSACGALRKRTALADPCKNVATGGDLAQICSDMQALEQERKGDQAARERLKRAEEALAKAAELAAKAAPTAASKIDLPKIQTSLEGLPADERLKTVLDALDKIFSAELADSLGAAAEAGATELKTAGPLLVDALKLIDALDRAQSESARAPLDEPTALLIGLAKVRHDRAMIDLDIEAANGRHALLLSEASLLRTQLYHLAQARELLCTSAGSCGDNLPSSDVDEALSHYVRSQNLGRTPFELQRFRELQLQRSTALKRAATTEADYRALVQPAIDVLARYGAGGIKPETLGEFLGALPVTGAILAK